jgi:hypothetical protein
MAKMRVLLMGCSCGEIELIAVSVQLGAEHYDASVTTSVMPTGDCR